MKKIIIVYDEWRGNNLYFNSREIAEEWIKKAQDFGKAIEDDFSERFSIGEEDLKENSEFKEYQI